MNIKKKTKTVKTKTVKTKTVKTKTVKKYKIINHKNNKNTIQKGGANLNIPIKTIQCENSYAYFNNAKGTCWMITSIMIILINDEVALNKLYTHSPEDIIKSANPEYISLLPIFFFTSEYGILNIEYKTFLLKFFVKLKERFANKSKQELQLELESQLQLNKKYTSKRKAFNYSIHSLKRAKSINYSINSKSETCELMINKSFRQMFKYNGIGGTSVDTFFLNLLFSIFLTNKLYDKFDVSLNKNIILSPIKNVEELIGIEIYLEGHVVCFYKCKNTLMFCSNEITLPYNWINFCNFINKNFLLIQKSQIKLFVEEQNVILFQNRMTKFILNTSISDSEPFIENAKSNYYKINYISCISISKNNSEIFYRNNLIYYLYLYLYNNDFQNLKSILSIIEENKLNDLNILMHGNTLLENAVYYNSDIRIIKYIISLKIYDLKKDFMNIEYIIENSKLKYDNTQHMLNNDEKENLANIITELNILKK